ncbi:ArpU family transcriptional regulator, partial [[Clostridium] innocuum]|nr:ArpU family transcriptional regulator [[Clostridium] innocuum]
MKALEDCIDVRQTRREVQKHLKVLGKRMFRSQILDYMSISGSILSGSGNHGSADNGGKLLKAMEKAEQKNADIQTYIESLMNGLNKLEEEQRDILLAKYLYKLDDEEFEEQFNTSMRTIYTYIKE